jgi:hypothetical protein
VEGDVGVGTLLELVDVVEEAVMEAGFYEVVGHGGWGGLGMIMDFLLSD